MDECNGWQNFSSDVPGSPQQAVSDRPGERAQLVYYEPPGQAVPCVGCGPNHEEMVSVATDEGGSHGNPVYRHGVTTPSLWPAGLAPVVPYVHKVSVMTSGGDSGEGHVVKQPLQCTSDPSVAAASGPVEETGTTSTALVVALSNSKVNASAVDLYKDHTKDCVQLAKIQKIEVLHKEGHIRVHRCAPFPCTSIRELLCTRGNMVVQKNESLWVMNALFKCICTLMECHAGPADHRYSTADRHRTMHGGISNLSNILISRFTGRMEDLQVCLLPSLDNFVNAVEKMNGGLSEVEVERKGRLLDIKALGGVLAEVLAFIQAIKLPHVSFTIQRNMKAAQEQCEEEASTRVQLAYISQMLRCHEPFSMLYLEGLGPTLGIVCYKRTEQIRDVLDEWYKSCGNTSLSRRIESEQADFKLRYTSYPQVPVHHGDNVDHPSISVTLFPHWSWNQLEHL